MKLGYSKYLIMTTDDLPGILCDPPIKIKFINFSSVRLIREIGALAGTLDANDLDESTICNVAEKIIISVYDDDGVEYPMNHSSDIQDLLDTIGFTMLGDIVIGWVLIASKKLTEINDRKKKSKILKVHSRSTSKVG